MELERNDVDINKLFNWGKVFEIVSNDDVITLVYMRVLGDADLNKARVYALRESGKLRRALRDIDSDDRLVSIRDIEDLSEDDLVNSIIIFSTRELTDRMWKEIKIEKPKQPKSDAPLEKLEKYQKEIDEFPEKRHKAIQKAMEKEVEKLKGELTSKSKEELYKLYVDKLINELCEQKVLMAFREISTYYGCYKDDEYKEKFFNSFEDFQNIEPDMKAEFISAYSTMEIGTEEIKKLREATL